MSYLIPPLSPLNQPVRLSNRKLRTSFSSTLIGVRFPFPLWSLQSVREFPYIVVRMCHKAETPRSRYEADSHFRAWASSIRIKKLLGSNSHGQTDQGLGLWGFVRLVDTRSPRASWWRMPIRNRTVRVEDVFGSRDPFTDGQISDQYKRAVIRLRKGKVKNTRGIWSKRGSSR